MRDTNDGRERAVEVLEKFGYGAARLNCAMEGGVAVAMLRGLLTERVLGLISSDVAHSQWWRRAGAGIVFLDRAVLAATLDGLLRAVVQQTDQGRLCLPCALVVPTEAAPMFEAYAEAMWRRGLMREVFAPSASTRALEWAQARAATAQAQAIYLSRASRK